ncbi:hypothetical protein [Roseobacter sp. CCS2]|uniref:hypothetical protein n=1 Tax=Roseobacter sp. CCS2 TaxID=391593 RepID=UPI0000F3E2D0|nr:hypothetical protein [Roseobacter sp. CCS2]EBA12384.1 hypothetical protein RCCS2_13844 [Roseobacter sp. CCS2]
MSYLRIIGVFLFLAPFTAMFGEPFYEALFDRLGWDTETLAGPVMNWVSENTAVLTLAMGLGAGIWIHYWGQKVSARMGDSEKEIDWAFLESEIHRIKILIAGDIARKDEVEDGFSTIGQESFSGFYALLMYLSERNMAPEDGIPSPQIMVDEDLFFEISTRYIAAVEPYIRAKNPRGVRDLGGSIINLVYQWEREKRIEESKVSPQ